METIAEAFTEKVFEGLTSLALEEFKLLCNLNNDLQRMKDKVSAIKAVLRDAEEKAANHQVSDWLEKLKDTLYDADDLLDDFSTEALKRDVMTRNKMAKKVRVFFSKSNQILYGLKMGHRMREIRQRLDDIADDKNELMLSTELPKSLVEYNKIKEWRETYSLVQEDEIIGREEAKEIIVSLLLGPNVKDVVSVIAIVGIGGLGKTALAQLVYNDEAVEEHFEEKMWVCVSEEFVVKQIAQKMLGYTNLGEPIEQVQQQLIGKVKAKKFLLVLDDVWNENRELWHDLEKLLMEGAQGSMVIVTTRKEGVAKAMGVHTDSTHVLKGLDEEKSWKLFSKRAFKEGKEPKNPELVAIGKGIVKKCGGVPLAIRAIGSLLYSQELKESVWSYFRDVELQKIDDQRDTTFAVLKLSYDHLSSPLKNCFAYCSLFPKDCPLHKKQLIQLWVAEGFIQATDQIKSLEEVGDEYFKILLSNSFFQVVGRERIEDIDIYKMHDLMHDLALSVAGHEYVVMDRKKENITDKIRHLSFNSEIGLTTSQFSNCLAKADKSRTFFLPQGPPYVFDASPVFLSLKCSRVLDLNSLEMEAIPKTIEKLKHLRYLNLSHNLQIEKLPQGIVNLHNLQTLKLNGCLGLEELPKDINKLVSLRHLELDGCRDLRYMPRGLGQLTCLQTLTLFKVDGERRSDSARISELGGLNNLRGYLYILGLEQLRGYTQDQVELKSAKLIDKPYLQHLALEWTNYGNLSEEIGCEDEKILEGLRPHHSIKELFINGFCGKRLPEWIPNLSSLSRLAFRDCHGLASLPVWMCNLTSLEHLRILNCPQLKERCEKEVGADWPKIAHIPELYIS